MKIIVKTLSYILICLLILSLFTNSFASVSSAAQNAVYNYFNFLSNNQWNSLSQLIADEDQAEFNAFISNTANATNHVGYYNYSNVEIISCELVTNNSFDLSYIDADKCANYTDWKCWDCIVDITVHRETSYLHNGANRFIVYTALDNNGNYRVCEVLRIRDYQVLEDTVSTFSYDAPVSASFIGVWEMPETILVRRMALEAQTGTVPIIDEVDFITYCYIVTQNEFGTSTYNEEARKAVALCVKQYGWNRTLVQKYSAYEYDVKDNTYDQVYNPSKIPSSKVIAAVDAIWDYVMLSCDLKLFCSFYVASSSINSYAIYHGGILSQNKANSLGNDGYTWSEILHYFYDYGTYNLEMAQGIINIIDMNHTPSGISRPIRNNLYNHLCDCTVCGCTHEVSHTWSYANGTNICSVCGMTADNVPVLPW